MCHEAVCTSFNVPCGCVYMLHFQQQMQVVVCSHVQIIATPAVALSRSETVQRKWLACIVCQVTQVNKIRVLKSAARLPVSRHMCLSNNA